MSKSNVAYLNEALSANDWGDPHGRQVTMLNMISAADWLADKCDELDRQNEELRKQLVPQPPKSQITQCGGVCSACKDRMLCITEGRLASGCAW